jgi:acetone carboxylase gamma subunit
MKSQSRLDAGLSFIEGSDFGIETWIVIHNFHRNVQRIITSIELYGILIEKVDTDKLLAGFSDKDAAAIKQQIILDAILKLQILIECTLVLTRSLSRGYRNFAENMTYYDAPSVRDIVTEVRRKRKLKNYTYNMRRVLGLPAIHNLTLTVEEKKFINKDFTRFQEKFLDVLQQMAAFYDKFNVVYGKSKHGLAYITGGLSNTENINEGFNSVLHCYSNITKREKMPRDLITVKKLMATSKSQDDFFNFISVIKFDKKLIDEINSTMGRLKEFIDFVCSNHESFALNCGKGYVPYHRRDNTITMITSGPADNPEEQELINSIAKKNLATMYVPEKIEDVIKFSYINPEVIRSLQNNTVTNILISGGP